LVSIIAALAAQTYASSEVIVVDNGSTDGSLLWLRSQSPSTRIVEMGRNAGFSAALNAGLQTARGEYVLSLNFDVDLAPTFIEELVGALRSRPDAGWAAGAMRQLGPSGPIEAIDCNGHYMLRSRCCYGYDPERPALSAYASVAEVFGASGCAAMYRRDMLDAIAIDGQIFDEDLFAYFEDIDVDWRAQHAGYRCLFVPAAKGAHVRGGTGLSGRPEVAALLLSNRFLVMAKNDNVSDVWQDLGPIVRRTFADIKDHVVRGQSRALWLALGRVLRLSPRMLRKRHVISQRRAAGDSPVRRLRMRSEFLG
jgi:GT2 family glycosyltransferase